MRAFLILMHRGRTDPDFSLSDLPGSGGRMDILCRFITSSLLISHGIRKDTIAYGLLLGPPRPPVSLKVIGSEVKYLNPDERSTGALIRNGLIKLDKEEREGWIRTSPGIYFSRKGLKDLLEELSSFHIYLLNEDGRDFFEAKIELPAAFVLSDHLDFEESELNEIERKCEEKISLGPLSLHSEHCVVIVHNLLDRREASVRLRDSSLFFSKRSCFCERREGMGTSWRKNRRRGEPRRGSI